MPVSNLPAVTDAMSRLLMLNVRRLTGAADITVTNLPPEKADEGNDTHLNLHLYLASFDADGGTGVPFDGMGLRPKATTPLPLKLYYVMTAHASGDDGEDIDISGQQALIGWGMKTFHDYPVINDTLAIGPDPVVLGGETFGSRGIEIILRPVTPEESVSFWSTDQVRTARLAAYYEVRTLLLPPEARTADSGVVADLALGVFAGGPPTLLASRSVQMFTRPAALGGGAMAIARRPAVAMLRAAAADDAVIEIDGRDLGDGSDATLILYAAALPGGSVMMAPDNNAAWLIDIGNMQMRMTVRPVIMASIGAAVNPVSLLPGIYALALSRRRTLLNEDGTVSRQSDSKGNQVAFAIAPAIANATVDAASHIIVEVDPAFDTGDAGAEPVISISGRVYSEVGVFSGVAATDAGRFIRVPPSSYAVAPLFDPAAGPASHPIRLTVNGVDAQPFWMEVA